MSIFIIKNTIGKRWRTKNNGTQNDIGEQIPSSDWNASSAQSFY